MRSPTVLDPLELAKQFGVTQRELALRLGVTLDHARRLARNPKHLRRVRLAVLEEIVERERLAVAVEGWLSPVPHMRADHES